MKTFTRPVGFKSLGRRKGKRSIEVEFTFSENFNPQTLESVSREEGEVLWNRSGISSTYTVSKNRLSMRLSLFFSLVLVRITSLFLSFAMFGVTAAVLKIGVRWFGNVHRCFCTATITRACARINRSRRLSYWINLIFPFIRARCSASFGNYDDDDEL